MMRGVRTGGRFWVPDYEPNADVPWFAGLMATVSRPFDQNASVNVCDGHGCGVSSFGGGGMDGGNVL